jgi:hypothetical protein
MAGRWASHPIHEETMSQHEKPADTSAQAAAPSQDKRLPGAAAGDPVAAAEEHLAGVDMAAQRAIVRQLTK